MQNGRVLLCLKWNDKCKMSIKYQHISLKVIIMMMKIAIPIDNHMTFYHKNPFTAPQFAIYTIELLHSKVFSTLQKIITNPLINLKNGYKSCQISCECSHAEASDSMHIDEHFYLLDSIEGCNYLLSNHYCNNLAHTLQHEGISIYKIPPFIHRPNFAIKNFLLGAEYANTIQSIHHAS